VAAGYRYVRGAAQDREGPVSRDRNVLYHLLRAPALVLWMSYVLLIPFYVMPSGLPQPSDLIIVVLFPFALLGWNGRIGAESATAVRRLLWFTIWVAVVNYGWATATGKWDGLKDYLLFPFFYLFNLGIFTTALILYRRFGDVFLRLTIYCVFADVIILVAASFVVQSDQIRGSLFFNSPNQLGYYALLAATLIVAAQPRLRFGVVKASAALTGCAYLAIISASRAALTGIAILLVLMLVSNLRVIILASVASIALISIGGPVARAIDSAERRTESNRETSANFAEKRGYDRMWEYKEYMVLGAGEGNNVRFTDRPKTAHELHSSLATIIFCYGIVGAILFGLFLAAVMRGASWSTSLNLLPVAAYSVAHQGLRFTMLWLLLAAFMTLRSSRVGSTAWQAHPSS
jgi:hypothetical protein